MYDAIITQVGIPMAWRILAAFAAAQFRTMTQLIDHANFV